MFSASSPALPASFLQACHRQGILPGRFVLLVRAAAQHGVLFEKIPSHRGTSFARRRRFIASTSRFGINQVAGSNGTPLGLHRIAKKIGGGHPIGTVFKSRVAIGLTWDGLPNATIAHRILWLEGLEPGFNRGGKVDTFARYIYIHGIGDETTLGRPASHGCIHLAAADLLPLFDKLPVGTLVWIAQ